MSKPTTRTRVDLPLYDDGVTRKDEAMAIVADDGKGKRLRNAIILANLVVWVVIIAFAKWLFF